MPRQWIATALVTVVALGMALPAFAVGSNYPPDYPVGAGAKLARGLTNAATGWYEIPKQTNSGGRRKGAPGAIGGFVKGLALGVARTAAGGYELATFWAPIPTDFEPMMRPATVFEDR
jgi:putative exosortase-associated protein (TIGR04073 family)